jgi:UDP-N-acetylglucosamine 2-epimerase (non-hydrolysing)
MPGRTSLLTTSRDADQNDRRGSPEKIHRVGNVMIDSLRRFEERCRSSRVLETLGLPVRGYALVTLHRPSNVDRREDLDKIVSILEGLSERLPVVFPIHPRTAARIEGEGFKERLSGRRAVHLRPPEGYIDFLRLMSSARIVLTDSGGIQEETTVLGVPCLTLRPNTERPITITEGTNRLVGSDPQRVLSAVDELLYAASEARPRIPELWDGRAAGRIVRILEEGFGT